MKKILKSRVFLAVLIVTLMMTTFTGCSSSEENNQNATIQPTIEVKDPVASIEPQPTIVTPAIEIPQNSPTDAAELTPTAEPTQEAVNSDELIKEQLADTSWLAVCEKGEFYDGSKYESDLKGDSLIYELAIFADGTAQYLRSSRSNYHLTENPEYFWQVKDGKLILSRNEDPSLDDEYETEYGYLEDGQLVMENGGSFYLYFDQTYMLGRREHVTEWDMYGLWKLTHTEIEGYEEYDLPDTYLYIYYDYDSDTMNAKYYSERYEMIETKEFLGLEVSRDFDLASGWAPYCAVNLHDEGEKYETYYYLSDYHNLCVENWIYYDGSPAIGMEFYTRMYEREGILRLQEESKNKNIIYFTIEDQYFVTPEDTDLIELFDLPEDLDGYDYEIVRSGEEVPFSMRKDKGMITLFDFETARRSMADWKTLVNRLLEYSDAEIPVLYWTDFTSDGVEEIIALDEIYYP